MLHDVRQSRIVRRGRGDDDRAEVLLVVRMDVEKARSQGHVFSVVRDAADPGKGKDPDDPESFDHVADRVKEWVVRTSVFLNRVLVCAETSR